MNISQDNFLQSPFRDKLPKKNIAMNPREKGLVKHFMAERP